jgi:hypothetical protein
MESWGDFLHPNFIARDAIISAEEYKKANLPETVLSPKNRSGIQSKWKAPSFVIRSTRILLLIRLVVA